MYQAPIKISTKKKKRRKVIVILQILGYKFLSFTWCGGKKKEKRTYLQHASCSRNLA
jgi:hypothetical protein